MGSSSPLVSAADLLRFGLISGGRIVAAVTPPALDRWVVKQLARAIGLARSMPSHTSRRQVEAMIYGGMERETARRCLARFHRRRAEQFWGRLREMQPAGWRVEIAVEGEEHLQAARRKGRGVVVWFPSFCDTMILMRGLAEVGSPVVHLSAHDHGAPGRSRLGRALITPVHVRAETRYLARRVAMAAPDRPGYFRDLVGELRGGAVVTVRGDHPAPAGSPRGRFLGRPTAFARGAPTLALRAGAELVTARVIRVGSCRYRLTVEPPIELSREDRDHFLAAAVAEFAGRLERNALAFPSDWEGWLWLQELVATEPARVDAAAQSGSGSRGGAVGGVI